MVGGNSPLIRPLNDLEKQNTYIEVPPGALLMSIDEWITPIGIVDGVDFATGIVQEIGDKVTDVGAEILMQLVLHANTIHSLANAAEVVGSIINYLQANNISLSSFLSQLDDKSSEIFQGFLEQ